MTKTDIPNITIQYFMTEATVPSWKQDPCKSPQCFTLDELVKGESNEIHSIASRKLVLN